MTTKHGNASYQAGYDWADYCILRAEAWGGLASWLEMTTEAEVHAAIANADHTPEGVRSWDAFARGALAALDTYRRTHPDREDD